MCGGSGDAFVQDISNPGIETGNAGDIGRPRFKDARDSPWLFPFKGMDAVAAGDVRRHDGIAADDDASRPAGTIQRLVARKTGRRHDAVGQVDVNGTSRLGHIDDESQMVAPAKGLDAGQIEDIAGDIGSVVADEPFCLRRQQGFHRIVLQGPAGLVAADESQRYAFFFQLIQRPQDGIVLPRRRQDAIARRMSPLRTMFKAAVELCVKATSYSGPQ